MSEQDDASEETERAVSRRSVLGAVGAGVALGSLPAAGASGGEAGADAATQARIGRHRRGRLYPVDSDFHGSTPQRLRAKRGCFKPQDRPIYGPTDVNAQSANGSLAVALNDAGTMSVFRWPRPSFYEQLKYFAEGR
ncbi:hypothetical protein BRC99_06790, partial [Halobacteriales archaeon QS_7_69_60]